MAHTVSSIHMHVQCINTVGFIRVWQHHEKHDLICCVSKTLFEHFFQTVTVHMTDEEMENFVFAVLPKKTAAKMQKELQDLVIKVLFVPLQNHPFPK